MGNYYIADEKIEQGDHVYIRDARVYKYVSDKDYLLQLSKDFSNIPEFRTDCSRNKEYIEVAKEAALFISRKLETIANSMK